MTYLDAAYTILKAAGQPLHFEEITQRALAQKLIAPQGLTPEATMGSRLYTDTKQEGSYFVRAGHGCFGLAEWQPKGIDAYAHCSASHMPRPCGATSWWMSARRWPPNMARRLPGPRSR